MSAIKTITKASHLIDMNDIIREGHPTLSAVAQDVTFPLNEDDIILGEKMLQFLKNSQDPVTAEKMELRGGVGLAAPQLDISKRIIAHSVQDAALADGEGCLSVDRVVEGYVIRHSRVTIEYYDKNSDKKKLKLKGYQSIVVQHEIDHTNGIMFFDRINEKNPFEIKEGLLLIE